MSPAERKLLGFVAEVYSYIVLSNSITPFDMDCNKTLVYDSFLHSTNPVAPVKKTRLSAVSSQSIAGAEAICRV